MKVKLEVTSEQAAIIMKMYENGELDDIANTLSLDQQQDIATEDASGVPVEDASDGDTVKKTTHTRTNFESIDIKDLKSDIQSRVERFPPGSIHRAIVTDAGSVGLHLHMGDLSSPGRFHIVGVVPKKNMTRSIRKTYIKQYRPGAEVVVKVVGCVVSDGKLPWKIWIETILVTDDTSST